uniref:Lipocalin/cytosolic fatty-acid binding domain-containing protein n=1 Tax=Periophthalmus magnuspinnatus TaxID=409849 RepID=A0A3B3ZDD6_9GOBI
MLLFFILLLTLSLWKKTTRTADGSCWRATHVAKKTDTPGRFIFHSHVWNDDNDMRIVEVVYDNYALAHTIKTKNGVQLVLNKLYSRTTQASNDLQQKFRQFSLDTGVLAENILILPPNGHICLQGRQRTLLV